MIAEKGIVKLEGLVKKAVCDAAAKVIKAQFNRNEYHSGRIVNLHASAPELLEVSAQVAVKEALTELFPSPMVYTSLSFEYGTQQNIHLDVPHFWTKPLYEFAGVWTALEDIHPDAGGLEYYEGSHQVEVMTGVEFLNGKTAKTKQEIEAALVEYELYLDKAYKKAGCKKKVMAAKKGDVIIWHPLLAHGGSKVKDLTKTRLSYVTHWKSQRSAIGNASYFFNDIYLPPYERSSFEHNGVRVYNQPPAFEQKAYV